MNKNPGIKILGILILLSPFPMGSALCWSLYLLLFFVAFSAYKMWPAEVVLPPEPEIRVAQYAFKALGVFALIQLIPLPKFVIKILSPGEMQILNLAGFDPSVYTLSLIPARTFFYILGTLPLILLIIALWMREWKKDEFLFIFRIILVTGLVQAIIALLRFATKVKKLFLFFGPEINVNYATGTLRNPDHFAAMMEIILPISIAYVIYRSKEKGFFALLNSSEIPFVFVPFFVLAAAILAGSRAGMGALLVSVVLVFYLILYRNFHPVKRSFLRSLLIFVAVGIIFFGTLLTYKKFTGMDPRPEYWAATSSIYRDFPIFGTGFSTFPSVVELYIKKDYNGVLVEHAHNDYLELLSEAGIVGFALIFIPILALLLWNFRHWEIRRYYLVRIMNAGILAALSALAVHSFFDFPMRVPAIYLMVTTLFGMSLALVNFRRKK